MRMNQRIKELLDKATYDVLGVKQVDQKQFAELIVGECSRIADDWVNDKDDGKNYPSEMIKQHFGVNG